MVEKLNESLILKTLNWAYEKALTQNLPGLDSAFTLAEQYLKQDGSLEEKIDSLIRWQNTKAATLGFITGLGGIIAIPVTLPSNIAGVSFVQIRMIAAIAIMNGYDVHDDRVKTMVFACLCGSAGAEILKKVGINIGSKVLHNVIQNISKETIMQLNKAIGFRLLAKSGGKSPIVLGKAVPLLGGVIGAAFDGITTNAIGNVAKKAFLKNI
ncbi:EcsC family protein [Pigmentibacter sp. JX0631]|uniref:EcsC family protein n=1 Tax=Pigmentibacter sp. JX0631 TaxID=2976982 RepID=UPI002468B322|nr:EcsC family protein [Pigmentibacter sp. JX0631]WGL59908.1 EcsC family protein [Pigmentibacter sp. JX0631]